MAITEALGALGSWTLDLKEDTPREIRERIRYFGHITVHTGRVEPALVGDGLLSSSRYTGVLRGKGERDEGFTISGCGMEFWLGDEDDKGVVIEDLLVFEAETPTQTVRDLLALTTAVQEGTFYAVPGTYSGQHQFEVLRKAIAYVATTTGIEYRINGDATMDLGAIDDLYVTSPKCLIIKRGAGVDMDLRALLGKSQVDTDVEDYTTRALLLAASTESQVATGSAELDPGEIPYKDRFGNPVKLTRMISESTTDATNADARAQLQLNRFSQTRDALQLSTSEYDINGSARIGDYVGVYNPDQLLVDYDNEVPFRGALLNPINLRLIETTWPVAPGFMVAYRDPDGAWLDLTDYVKFEVGQTTLKVGGYNRSLTGSSTEPIGRLPQPDTSVPAQVVWVEPFRLGVYQSAVTGQARGEVLLEWLTPLNTNGLPVVDGSHYEIRYRTATMPLVPTTHDMMSVFTHDELAVDGTYNQPITFPATEWQRAIAPWDSTTFRLLDLVPSMGYEVQIRAVDLANPTNYGAWSELVEFQTTHDNIAPAIPAPPEVAANLLAVQVVHRLGASSGGTFNLDRDLHHLEVHGGSEPLFHPDDTTLLGKMMANWGMIVGQIPAVATFPVRGAPRPPNADPGEGPSTDTLPLFFKVMAVDESGNKSLASAAAESSADLISSQYVSDLTASKITAGRMTAEVLMAGRITTAEAGPRVQMSHTGMQGYKEDGTLGLDWKSSNGLLHVLGEAGIKVTGGGNVEITDGALVVKNANGNVIVEVGECQDGRHGIQVFKDNGLRVARIGELESAGGDGIEFVDDLGRLVRANTMAFGIKSATITTVENGVSTAGFQNFSAGGAGPSVTVTIGNTLTAIVMISSIVNPLGSATGGSVSFNTFGPAAYFAGASELRSLWNLGVDAPLIAATKAFNVVVPTAGDYTFTMVRWTTGPAGTETQYGDRHIIAIPY
jgi:hypothetical protein